MSYIKELRQIIGSKPIIAVGATIIVRNDYGELLLNCRTDTDNWGIPGGAMEPGESIEDTARRELAEETGLHAKELKLLDVLSGPEFFFTYPNGDQIHCVIILYEALNVTGDLEICDNESTQLAYFPLNNLPELEQRAASIIKRLTYT
ncbi:MAG: NUDIX hydrolase [Armatimonadota bacterium]